MAEPTETMRQQMRIHTRYMQACQGWTGDECRALAADYTQAMQTPEGFAMIEAHLASVIPHETAALEARERNAA
jgi:hypothetical protein